MASQSSHDFILWAIPRFRRPLGVSAQAMTTELARRIPSAQTAVAGIPENISATAKNFAVGLENSEPSCWLTASHHAYH